MWNLQEWEKTSVLGHPQDVNADLESMKENYNRAKRAAKLAIFNAKNAERLKFCEKLEDEDRKGNVFRVAKQLAAWRRGWLVNVYKRKEKHCNVAHTEE